MEKFLSYFLGFFLLLSLMGCAGTDMQESSSRQTEMNPEDVPKPDVPFVNKKTVHSGDLTPDELQSQLQVNHDLIMDLLKGQKMDLKDAKMAGKALDQAMLTYTQMDGLNYLDRLRTPEALMKAYFSGLDNKLPYHERVTSFREAYPVAASTLDGFFSATERHLQAMEKDPNAQDNYEQLVKDYEKDLQKYRDQHPEDLYKSEKLGENMDLKFYTDGTVAISKN